MAALRDGFPVMAGHLPGIGHALTLHKHAVPALQRAEKELGSFVKVHLGFGQWYLFCLGTGAFELLKHKNVLVGESRASLEYLLGKSLLTLDGAPHRSVRSAMNPSFSPRGLGESGAEKVVSETVLRHVQDFVSEGGGDVHARAQAMALDVIFRIVGVEVGSLSDWHAHYRRVFWGLVPVPVEWPGTPRYFALRATAWINERLLEMVRRARRPEDGRPGADSAPPAGADSAPPAGADSAPPAGADSAAPLRAASPPQAPHRAETLLHALANARDDEGRLISDEALVDNLRLLFIAGHETTATTMTWATLHLAERPDLVRRLQEEVAAAGISGPLSLADARKLPLCEGVFREAVRLYTPGWFIERRLTGDVTYLGRALPAGTKIAVCPPLWARDPALYTDPEAFEPDRWVGKSAAPTPIELASFGGGAHFCLGYHLSWLESVEYVALLVQALAGSKKRLRLAAPRMPQTVYFPMPRPSPAARVIVAPE